MHAPATTKNLPRSETRIGIVILVLLGLVTVGAFVTAERAGVSPAVVGPQPNTLPEAVAVRPLSFEQMRFIEMNVLPESRPAGPLTAGQTRLFEINMLPGDDAPLVAPFSDRLGERY